MAAMRLPVPSICTISPSSVTAFAEQT